MAAQQCLSNAESINTLTQGTGPLMAAIQQCEQSATASQTSSDDQIAQITQTMIATVNNDVQKSDQALRSISGIMTQEATLASNLEVPPATASEKEALLVSLEKSGADALMASGQSSVAGVSAAAQTVSSDVGAASDQETSLVAAMRDG